MPPSIRRRRFARKRGGVRRKPLSHAWDQPVLVANRGGAGDVLGSEVVAPPTAIRCSWAW
jgi:hypothetical protein